uniref:hypothetical protein n=1 Tax=Spirosoma sp. SC4-14 TaxID=3128900 RepID=UPI00403FA3C7
MLTEKNFSRAFEWKIQDQLNILELQTDWVVNAFVYSKADWLARSSTDFHRNVVEDRRAI